MNASEIARSAVERGVAPAAAAGAAARTAPTRTDTPHPADAMSAWVRETGGATGLYFDLASVTKPMTAVAVARARIDPSTRLGALVAEARGTSSADVPLELLLAHRAGLAGHRALYAPLVRGQRVDVAGALAEAAAARRPELLGASGGSLDDEGEGFAPLYSDLGYALAGEALARATGARDAGDAIRRLVLEPLGLAREAGTVRDLAAAGVAGPFAPTEDLPWRGGVVQGAVHDENAWALTGLGGSGHAGIFGTIDAVVTFGVAVLDGLAGRGTFGGDSLAWLVRPRPGGTLRAGFDGKSDEGSSAGQRIGPNAFGHLGFTGTSLWLDPDAEVVVALLTNRVCPSREHRAIREERPRAHDSLFDRAVLLRGP
jgi:CubicO group peptidase (beta-lactamase class C family)